MLLEPRIAIERIVTQGKLIGNDPIHKSFLGASHTSLFYLDETGTYIFDTNSENGCEIQAHTTDSNNEFEILTYRLINWKWEAL